MATMGLALILLSWPLHTCAQTAAPDPDTMPSLPDVTVRATARPPEVQSDAMRSRTAVDARAIERRQVDSVFELMDEIPGVVVEGGVRNSGKTFNIRGYNDSEDIRIDIDGVSKGFEKYRFGGTFIEPDLLKRIAVQRGAQIESGPGSQGGTVRATTRDARDLLRPGQQWGARLRLGHAANNNERHRFGAAYGRPSERTEGLIGWTRRDADDITLASGRKLPLSGTDMGSTLLKASWLPTDTWRLTASWLRYHDQGLQAYDTTGEDPGLFGQTQRRIDDDTLALRAEWVDDEQGHSWTTTLGHGRTRVRDHFEGGWSPFSPAHLAPVNDDIDYRQHTLDSRLSWRWLDTDDWQLSTHVGLQAQHSTRTSTRVTRNALVNQLQYPDGHNPAQPAGQKEQLGGYVQLDLRAGRWQLLPGWRWDEVRARVEGPNAQALAAAGEADRIRTQHGAPHLSLAYHLQPERWTLFASHAPNFRAPLLDDAFARSGYGNCTDARVVRRVYDSAAGAQVARVPGYAPGARVVPTSGVCAHVLRVQTAHTHEVGVSTRQPDWLGPRSLVQAKLTAFQARSHHLLSSLMAEPGGSGRLIQPGWESRRGLELEASAGIGAWHARLNASRLRGREFDGLQARELLATPGDRIQLSLAWRPNWGEIGLRWQQVYARPYLHTNAVTRVEEVRRQPGYRLLGATFSWHLSEHLDLAIAGDNLANTAYLLDNGFGNTLGTQGPGRNLRVAVSARF